MADSQRWVKCASSTAIDPDASVSIWSMVNWPKTSLQPRPSPNTSSPGDRPVRNAARSASRYTPGRRTSPRGAARLMNQKSAPDVTATVRSAAVPVVLMVAGGDL